MLDLHVNTYYPEERFSPAEVIAAAASCCLRAIAICEHDAIQRSREAHKIRSLMPSPVF